jgi:putative ubiquitin-RnfH superfamily antitoxin RatB of RatAB toxin-antitoxin module
MANKLSKENNLPLRLTVVYSPAPREVTECTIELPFACSASQSLPWLAQALGLSLKQLQQLDFGVWAKRVSANYVLQTTDRIEIYRPLTVDPKVARRERFVRQGAKTAGLFSKLREGAKAGY